MVKKLEVSIEPNSDSAGNSNKLETSERVSKQRNETLQENSGDENNIGNTKSDNNTETEEIKYTYTQKYTLDLFYLVPFYHSAFPASLQKIIVMDADLEFRIDVMDLYKKFKEMNSSQIIGVGFDLTPHYYRLLAPFRSAHPESTAGMPGNQGFNTGVVLYDLAKMRQSQDYLEELDIDRMKEIKDYHSFLGTVGDQDWLTLVGFSKPWLFYPLGCEYNRQNNRMYHTLLKMFTEEEFERWHHCDKETKILHNNGK